MNRSSADTGNFQYCWYSKDLESKFGVRGSQFTHVNGLLWFLVAATLTAFFYTLLSFFPNTGTNALFTERGPFQYVTVVISIWAILLILVKWGKIRLQRGALSCRELVPVEADFVLTPATVGEVTNRLRQVCEDPERFVLFRRIKLALANLRNMGQVGDLDNVLESLANNDEDVMESSYTLIKGLIWAIPVLGFIGTVQGLGIAIGDFGTVLSVTSDMENLKTGLQGVTGGLATAFDTTFVALVASLGIQLTLVGIRKSEEGMMVGVKSYCQQYLVGRLRLTAYECIG